MTFFSCLLFCMCNNTCVKKLSYFLPEHPLWPKPTIYNSKKQWASPLLMKYKKHFVFAQDRFACSEFNNKVFDLLSSEVAISWIEGDAEDLPIASSSVDAFTIAFGIRNVTRIHKVNLGMLHLSLLADFLFGAASRRRANERCEWLGCNISCEYHEANTHPKWRFCLQGIDATSSWTLGYTSTLYL